MKIAAGSRLERPPAESSAATPGDPSAFMSTTVQRPFSSDQSSVCTPSPDACATQKSCVPGGGGTASPGMSPYSMSNRRP